MDTKNIGGFNMNGSPSSEIVIATDGDLECPFCHRGIETQPLSYVRFTVDNVQLFLKCKCGQSFVGYTNQDNNTNRYNITGLSKGKHKTKFFEKEIQEVSSTFVLTYGESEFAEQENLKQICGAGYRRAFEFLIKDYLIKFKKKIKILLKKNFLVIVLKKI